jgi:predicted TIM-barrel fold metal-dependent hydrolase
VNSLTALDRANAASLDELRAAGSDAPALLVDLLANACLLELSKLATTPCGLGSLCVGAVDILAQLAPIDRVATAHPRLPLVIAHAGQPAVDDAFDLMERHPCLHADLTSAHEWEATLPVARVEALHERLLFGSDCPNTTFTIAASADCIRRLDVSDRARRAILGENARRLTAV